MSSRSERMHSKGAMTLAMEAVRERGDAKVLRLGVIEDARVIDERVIVNDGPVTVGTTERCAIALRGADVPTTFTLFSRRGERYVLHFTDAMDGRVALDDGVHPLATLRTRARRDGAAYALELTERSRGRIVFGATSVLFQFVDRPPVAPRPQLPAAIRARPLRSMDWTYNACLAGFVALAFGGMSYVEYVYDPPVEDAFEIDVARTGTLLPPPSPEQLPTNTQQAMAAPPTPAPASPHDPEPASQHGPRDHSRPLDAAPSPGRSQTDRLADAARIALQASDATLHGLDAASRFDRLTSWQPGPGGITDRLAQGTPMDGTVRNLGAGITRDTASDALHRRLVATNGPPGDSLVRGHRIDGTPEITDGPGGPRTDGGPSAHVIDLPPDEPTGPGEVPQDDVARVVRQSLGGIRWCYNEAIRQNPTLSGRLEVHFTLGGAGRVIGAPELHGFDGEGAMRQCISNRFRSMRFPPAQGGAVSFTFPFQFSPGQ